MDVGLSGRRAQPNRIWGIDQVRRLGGQPSESDNPKGFLRRHPHTIGEWNANNTLYLGSGMTAKTADRCLRLTKPGASPTVWKVPAWLKEAGLTYHDNPIRWADDKELYVASRGQEFVSDIGERAAPRKWLRNVLVAIQNSGEGGCER